MTLAAIEGVLADLAELELPLTSESLFGNVRPLEVEIGSGKGMFILEWAAAHPERYFLGVERARKYLIMAATRATRRGLRNLRFVRTTAEDLLFRCLAPGSVSAVHVYFPDPWPKKRHRKRRFFSPTNLTRTVEVLTPGGVLRVKTDHLEYATEIAEALTAAPGLTPVATEEIFADVPPTHFEVKYQGEGRPIYRYAFARRVL